MFHLLHALNFVTSCIQLQCYFHFFNILTVNMVNSYITHCHPGWSPHGYYCYKILNTRSYRTSKVSEGNTWCRNENKDANLPIFRDQNDINFYDKPEFKNLFLAFGHTYILLGAEWNGNERDSNGRKVYRWYDGTRIPNHGDSGFQNWKNGQPNTQPRYLPEKSMGFDKNNGKWHDFNPNDRSIVICQRPAKNANGRWSVWKDVGDCSVKCGSGKQKQSRSCTDPAPKPGGEECDKINYRRTQERNVNCVIDCPNVVTKFSTNSTSNVTAVPIVIATTETSKNSSNIGIILGVIIPLLLLLLLLLFVLCCLWRRRRQREKEEKSASTDEGEGENGFFSSELDSEQSSDEQNVISRRSTEILGFDSALDSQENINKTDNKITEDDKEQTIEGKKVARKKAQVKKLKLSRPFKSAIGIDEKRASRLTTLKKRF